MSSAGSLTAHFLALMMRDERATAWGLRVGVHE